MWWRSRILRMMLAVFAVTIAGSSLWAGDGRRGHYDDDRWSLSLGFSHVAPYWRPYWPGHRHYYPWYRHPGYYYPAHNLSPYGPYRPPYGGRIGFGYHSGYYDDAFGLFFSLPLHLGPRNEPAPPGPSVLVPSVKRSARALPADCLQQREYQTEIVIAGEAVPAYGTACLEADGSWRIVSGPIAEE